MSDTQNTSRFSTIGVTYTKHQNNAALSMSPAEDRPCADWGSPTTVKGIGTSAVQSPPTMT